MRRFLWMTLPSLALLGGLAATALTLDRPRLACGQALALAEKGGDLALLRRAALAGAPQCQNALGMRYSYGKGVPEDAAEAARWFHRAAVAGLVAGQRNLGFAFARGLGVDRNPDLARLWLGRAAGQGDMVAGFQLGEVLTLRADHAGAARHYRAAAEQGYAPAQRELGDLYRLGRGVPQDGAQAEVWLRKAVAQDDLEARFLLAVVLRGDDDRHMDSAEAARLMREAAERGFVQAQRELGYMYRMGWCVPRDAKQAGLWLRRSAERGDDIGQFLLASLLVPSIGAERAPGAAADWVRKVAPANKAPAAKPKAKSASTSDANAKEAVFWLLKAAIQGYAPAQYNLARLYYEGTGVPRDPGQTYIYLSMAAEQGDEPAAKALAALEPLLGDDVKARARAELLRRRGSR